MNKMRARAQVQFPTVLLTLISIIQALALELMWSRLVESEWLWTWSVQAFIGWGMFSVTLLGILLIWATYSTMVMGFIWQPYLRDSILPFIIGIQQFMLVSFIGAEFSVLWLYVLASIFVSVNWVTHNSLRRARKYEENDEFFSSRQPATLRDFLPAMAVIAGFVIFGISIEITGNQSWLPITAIAVANSIVVFQLITLRRLWRSIMDSD